MRYLFILALLLVITSTAAAQTATIPVASKFTYYNLTTDYTLTNTTTSWFKWQAAKDYRSTQDFETHIDHLAGTHSNVAVSLWGRKFSADSWTQIGSTVNWKKTTSDTTIIISNTVTNRYREFKSNFVGTGTGTETIASQALKIWK